MSRAFFDHRCSEHCLLLDFSSDTSAPLCNWEQDWSPRASPTVLCLSLLSAAADAVPAGADAAVDDPAPASATPPEPCLPTPLADMPPSALHSLRGGNITVCPSTIPYSGTRGPDAALRGNARTVDPEKRQCGERRCVAASLPLREREHYTETNEQTLAHLDTAAAVPRSEVHSHAAPPTCTALPSPRCQDPRALRTPLPGYSLTHNTALHHHQLTREAGFRGGGLGRHRGLS